MASISPDVLRAELARALDTVPAPAAQGAAAGVAIKEPPPPSPEQQAALDKAKEGVDRTLARGNLTAADAVELRDLLHHVDGDSQSQLTLRLVAALDHGQLKMEPGARPF